MAKIIFTLISDTEVTVKVEDYPSFDFKQFLVKSGEFLTWASSMRAVKNTISHNQCTFQYIGQYIGKEGKIDASIGDLFLAALAIQMNARKKNRLLSELPPKKSYDKQLSELIPGKPYPILLESQSIFHVSSAPASLPTPAPASSGLSSGSSSSATFFDVRQSQGLTRYVEHPPYALASTSGSVSTTPQRQPAAAQIREKAYTIEGIINLLLPWLKEHGDHEEPVASRRNPPIVWGTSDTDPPLHVLQKHIENGLRELRERTIHVFIGTEVSKKITAIKNSVGYISAFTSGAILVPIWIQSLKDFKNSLSPSSIEGDGGKFLEELIKYFEQLNSTIMLDHKEMHPVGSSISVQPTSEEKQAAAAPAPSPVAAAVHTPSSARLFQPQSVGGNGNQPNKALVASTPYEPVESSFGKTLAMNLTRLGN